MKNLLTTLVVLVFGAAVATAQGLAQETAAAASDAGGDPFTEAFFAEVEGIPLGEAEAALVKGGDLVLAVHRNTQTMTVYNGTPAAIVNGLAEVYTVPVTTRVVQRSSPQDKDAMTRDTFVTAKNISYYPTQLPAGTYKLDYSTQDVAGYGPGIHIDAYVDTTVKNKEGKNESKKMNDYFVHGTDLDNTWGCVGVKYGNMSRVMNSYHRSYGPKILTIDAYSPRKSPSKRHN